MPATIENKAIRAVIVDDERLAIEGIEMLLSEYPGIHVVGTADSIDKAADVIQNVRPDIVFLDIQLQGETGFDLFDRLDIEAKVVFVTAFDDYAIRAFEVNALDYLLKPVSRERFQATISRAVGDNGEPKSSEQRFDLTDMVSLNTGRSIRFVKAVDIVCIHAVGDYSEVSIAHGTSELVYRTLKDWEKRLPPNEFVRVHRSSIVNMAHIDRIEPTTSNRFEVYLHHKSAPIVMSQRYSAQFRKSQRDLSLFRVSPVQG